MLRYLNLTPSVKDFGGYSNSFIKTVNETLEITTSDSWPYFKKFFVKFWKDLSCVKDKNNLERCPYTNVPYGFHLDLKEPYKSFWEEAVTRVLHFKIFALKPLRNTYRLKMELRLWLALFSNFEELFTVLDNIVSYSLFNQLRKFYKKENLKRIPENFTYEDFIRKRYGKFDSFYKDLQLIKKFFVRYQSFRHVWNIYGFGEYKINLGKVLELTAWNINEDLLVCSIGGSVCRRNPFKRIYTIEGICYRSDTQSMKLVLNNQSNEIATQTVPGMTGGLKIIFDNRNSYDASDYSFFTRDSNTVKMFVHSEDDYPAVKTGGYLLNAGYHHEISVTLKQKKMILQQNNGENSCTSSSSLTCFNRCLQKFRRKLNKCRHFDGSFDRSWIIGRKNVVSEQCGSMADVQLLYVYPDFLYDNGVIQRTCKYCMAPACNEKSYIVSNMHSIPIDEKKIPLMLEELHRKCEVGSNKFLYSEDVKESALIRLIGSSFRLNFSNKLS
ncbi:hypothetical protein SNEBB_006907 [Seison nebaliae]|nr:hypothetical protein SNEBB_006907 [Seison nebaliae]